MSEYTCICTGEPRYQMYGDRFSHLYFATYDVLVTMMKQKTSGPGASWPLMAMYFANGHLIQRGFPPVIEVPFNEKNNDLVTPAKPDPKHNAMVKIKLENEQQVLS